MAGRPFFSMAQVLMARACLLFLGQMSQRGGGVQPATRRLPRASCGGDEHPAAHVFRLEQADFSGGIEQPAAQHVLH